MTKRVSLAGSLVVLLLILLPLVFTVVSCSDVDINADVRFSAETGQLSITNNDTSNWSDVEVTLNHSYKLSIPAIPTGAAYAVDLEEFTSMGGQHFDPNATAPSAIVIECQTAKGYGLYTRVWD